MDVAIDNRLLLYFQGNVVKSVILGYSAGSLLWIYTWDAYNGHARTSQSSSACQSQLV